MNIPIKVINLERSIERRDYFTKNNNGLDYEFINGVDGKLLSDNEIFNDKLFIKPLPFPSRGAYGTALSHLKLWSLVIELNSPLTIAEDDAIFRGDFKIKSEEIISQLPENWDIVLWGWNFDSILSLSVMPNISPAVMIFNQKILRENIHLFKDQREKTYSFKLDKCFGTLAYTISPLGANNFKKQCFPMKNFELFFPVLNRKLENMGIDVAMNRIYSTTASYVSFPPLVVTKNDHSTSENQKSN
jgi:GR25 family glycosyltransferase involved in LPS biosynthesis